MAIDSYARHEVMDRTFVVIDILGRTLRHHHALTPEMIEQLGIAEAALAKLYQLAAKECFKEN